MGLTSPLLSHGHTHMDHDPHGYRSLHRDILYATFHAMVLKATSLQV